MPNDTTSELNAREALARNPFPDVPWIRIRGDGIAIVTGYSEALHRLLRWVPKAQWRVAERCWFVPFSGAEAVRAVLPEIMRLAEAARELDDPPAQDPALQSAAPDLLEAFVEAAALLHGPEWGKVASLDTASISDRSVVDLAGGLRQKAAALSRAAERLEARLGAGRGDDRT
jgi:hypothetical protein